MAQSQSALIDWCRAKIQSVRAEANELRAAYAEAKKNKWKTAVLERHYKLADKRTAFYGKMLHALEAGYIIVPPFPVTCFAVRTDRKKPLALIGNHKWDPKEQKAETLDTGEGEYRNPFPSVYVSDCTNELSAQERAAGKTLKSYYAESWRELEFPINMSKPHIMEATSRAMALKIFDDFGILPDPNPKKDPVIIARIRDPRIPHRYAQRFVSFIVAWHLDTRTL